ncbi:hypothetical protein THAOC_00140, partial [Thalassiosira oceanica]
AGKRGMQGCPFCWKVPQNQSQARTMVQKLVYAGDPVAIWRLGQLYCFRVFGVEMMAVTRAIELFERTAELGEDVEKDTAKA